VQAAIESPATDKQLVEQIVSMLRVRTSSFFNSISLDIKLRTIK